MLTPSPPSSLPRIREDLSRRREALRGAGKRIRGSRRSYRVDARKSLPPRGKNSDPGSSLPDPRKLFRWSVNSFRAPRVLSRAQDISSRRCELNSRRREFLRSHRNPLRSAPKELPNPSSLFLGTVYQYGKLHPSLGNVVKELIDTGNSVAAPGSASQRREFLHGLSALPRRPPSLFAAQQSASQTIRISSNPLRVPTQRCVFVRRLPQVAPSPSEFPQRPPCSCTERPNKEWGEGKRVAGIRVPSHAIRVPPSPRSLRSTAPNELGNTRSFHGGLRSGSQ